MLRLLEHELQHLSLKAARSSGPPFRKHLFFPDPGRVEDRCSESDLEMTSTGSSVGVRSFWAVSP